MTANRKGSLASIPVDHPKTASSADKTEAVNQWVSGTTPPPPEAENGRERMVRLSIDLPESLYVKFKIYCVTKKIRSSVFVREYIAKAMKREENKGTSLSV